jgi:hypothetical protein
VAGFDLGSVLSLLLSIISVAMSEDDAARFRKQAQECRDQAAKAVSPLDKEAWLRVAEESPVRFEGRTSVRTEATDEPLSACRRPERWLKAADPRPVPTDAPAIKVSWARPETGTLKAASAVIRSGPWLQTVAASRPYYPKVLSEHRRANG